MVKYITLRRWLSIMVTTFWMVSSSAQKGHIVNTGSYSYGLGGISTLISGPDALLGNFSRLSPEDKSGFLVTSNTRFSLSELTSIALGGYYQLGGSHLGAQVSSYGFESYREQTAMLSYARRLSSKMALSGSLGLYQLSLGEYGNTMKFIYNLGFSASLTSDLSYSFLISNLERSRIEDNTDMVTALQVGIKYEVSSRLACFLELDKELEEKLSVRVGLDYGLHPKFDLRAGFDAASGNSGGGFTYKFTKSIFVDGAIQYHSLLGLTPSVTIKYLNSQIDN